MGMLAWVMMGLAVWHFTIWLPDHALGGIVGAFVGAVFGAAIFGFIVSGFSVPGESETHLMTALEGIPGALLGIGVMFALGLRARSES
jgi:putative lipase involved disintegration of autophagic bodies